MIVWLNGAFGAGKTQTAHALARRLPDAFVFDPENAGYFLRKTLPADLHHPDFQDHPEWRQINRALLERLAVDYPGIVIVPMTVTEPAYFAALTDGLPVVHVLLAASRETLLRRLARRGDGRRAWPAQQIDRCLAAEVGLSLLPETRSRLQRWLDRCLVQIRHIRCGIFA